MDDVYRYGRMSEVPLSVLLVALDEAERRAAPGGLSIRVLGLAVQARLRECQRLSWQEVQPDKGDA